MSKKTSIYLLILMFLSLFVYWRWLSFDIFWAGDWSYYSSTTIKYFLTPSVWFNLNNLGSFNLTLWRLPLDFLQGVIGYMGYGSNVSEKIFIFWPTLIIGNLTLFFLVKKISKSNLGGFIGAIVFNYNTYYIVINTAFLLYAAAVWSVLALYTLIKFTEIRKKYLLILSTIFLFISSSYDFRIGYITILLIFIFYIYYACIINKISLKNIILIIRYFFIQIILFGLLSMYWILPFINSKSLTSNIILQRGLFGNEFSNILYSITLFHPFWTGDHTAYFHPQPIFIYFWIIPIIAFSGLYVYRKNLFVLFFGIIAILGIFLTKQVAHPFPEVYSWLFIYLPGFNAFREASKFYFLIILGYSVLIGSFISWLILRLSNEKWKILVKYLLIFIVFCIFFINTKPILTGDIMDAYVSQGKSPSDYDILNNYLEKQSLYFKTLWIPYGSNWSIPSENINIINAAYIFSKEWLEIYSNKLKIVKNIGQFIIVSFQETNTNNLLNNSSVRYLILPLINHDKNDNIYASYGEEKKYYVDNLSEISYLRKLDIGTQNIDIYENITYKPHIYITKEKETITKNISYKAIDFKHVNSSEYKLKLVNIKDPIYINFTDNFHPQWKIYFGTFKWYQVLFNMQNVLSEKNHMSSDAKLNSYFLDPVTTCNRHICNINKDGTYDINLTLYFIPQSYMNLGLIISGLTLILISGYFVLSGIRFIYERKN